MTTFHRNGDKADEWFLVCNWLTKDGCRSIEFAHGNHISVTIHYEDDELLGGTLEVDLTLSDIFGPWQEYDLDLTDPRYSMFAEWAKQIIKEEQETDQ
jgi:hypothetical protein